MNSPTLPTVVVTMGDPAGIGPEVALKAMARTEEISAARWVLIGEAWIGSAERRTTAGLFDQTVTRWEEIAPDVRRVLWDVRQLAPQQIKMGTAAAEGGRAGLQYVRRAVDACLSGQAAAMVTGPLSKYAVTLSGQAFTGHTEFIAERCGAAESRLMLVNDRLAVVHVSTHCRLSEATRVDEQRVAKTIQLGWEAMLNMRGQRPRVAVCGLNPHAGEDGLFGDDEQTIIAPAIARVRQRGYECEGPLPADTVFFRAVAGAFDLVVAMYHDQGHVPMKLLDFEHTVNVTLGLPIIRTSVDHGTAFDIAGQGRARADNMLAAMDLAVRLVSASFRPRPTASRK